MTWKEKKEDRIENWRENKEEEKKSVGTMEEEFRSKEAKVGEGKGLRREWERVGKE